MKHTAAAANKDSGTASVETTRTHLEGYEPNEAGLKAFNSIHNRKAFRLYADKHANWYVIYMPVHGIHASYGFGSEANRLVRSAIKGKRYRIA